MSFRDSRWCRDCNTRAAIVDHGLVRCECGDHPVNCIVCGDDVPRGRLYRGAWTCERIACGEQAANADTELSDLARRERRLSDLEEERFDRARGERVAAWFESFGEDIDEDPIGGLSWD